MTQIINGAKYMLSILLGTFSYFVGGWDSLLKTILCMAVLDFVTGILKSVYNKQLSSLLCVKGIIRKVGIFIVIAVSNFLQNVLSSDIPLREIIITFYIVNEAISILENISQFVPIPEKLKEVLKEFNETNN